MKKILIGLILLVAIGLGAVYLFIPGKLQTRASININAALPGVFRSLSNNNSWRNFWPGETPFKIGDNSYTIKGKSYNVLGIDISTGDNTITSTMNLLPVRTDFLTIEWTAEQISSSNPIRRFAQYRQASALEKELNMILGLDRKNLWSSQK